MTGPRRHFLPRAAAKVSRPAGRSGSYQATTFVGLNAGARRPIIESSASCGFHRAAAALVTRPGDVAADMRDGGKPPPPPSPAAIVPRLEERVAIVYLATADLDAGVSVYAREQMG